MFSTSPPNFAEPPRRILIIKPSAIGDVVHGLPILNLLRSRWPNAHIAWLVTPACAGLLQGHPQLNDVILFDRKRYAASIRSPRVAREFFEFCSELRAQKFDLVIDLQGLFRSGWLAWVTGAPVRVGAADARELAWIFYTHRTAAGPAARHAIERYLDIAQFVGLDRSPVHFVFPTNDDDRRAVATLLPDEPFAVLLPATNWPTKQWPIDKFASLVGPLKQMGLTSVLAGGPDADAMAPSLPGVINIAGRTTLRELVAVLERASLVIANDTGPMHIAAALGRPLVTMYGPTSPARTGPYDRDDTVVRLDIACSPCFSRTCCHHSCMTSLQIEPVLQMAKQQLDAEQHADKV